MFEVAELGQKLSKDSFKSIEPELHSSLLNLQQKLRSSNKSLVVIVSGVEGAGKGEVVDKLNRWFDTRDVQTHAFWNETDEEKERPRHWRYWRTLPARGSISIMFGSWYTKPIVDRALGKTTDDELESELDHIQQLERTLSRDGTIFVKLWFHLSNEEQQKRLKKDSKSSKFKKSPLLEEYAKSYPAFAAASEKAILQTDSGFAPWHIIEATDARYRDATAGQTVLSSLQQFLGDSDQKNRRKDEEEPENLVEVTLKESGKLITVLDSVDLNQSLEDEEYEQRLVAAQNRLNKLAWDMYNNKKNTVLVFEGWDAGGKGSSIRRLTSAIDARLYRVIPVAAPTDEELAHHYLWRFWRKIPRAGFISIYDRSWYGRVLVERVEKFAKQREWLRSYQEINEFENQLATHGVTVMKFWIHISKEEQLRRFKEREKDPRKQYKITDEDWRNREKWMDYKLAVNDMVAHTSTNHAPWHIIAGNDKKFARVQLLETVCEHLEKTLKKK